MVLTLIITSVLHVLAYANVLNNLDFVTHVSCLYLRVFVGIHWIHNGTLIMQKLLTRSDKIL